MIRTLSMEQFDEIKHTCHIRRLCVQRTVPRSIDTAIRIFIVTSANTIVYGSKQHVKEPCLPVMLDTVKRHRIRGSIFNVYGRISVPKIIYTCS